MCVVPPIKIMPVNGLQTNIRIYTVPLYYIIG